MLQERCGCAVIFWKYLVQVDESCTDSSRNNFTFFSFDEVVG
jgi:hypothetical protein